MVDGLSELELEQMKGFVRRITEVAEVCVATVVTGSITLQLQSYVYLLAR